MRTRTVAKATTRSRILKAVEDLATERLTVEVTLDDVAERAGVNVRTVLRHFGDREKLLDAAIEAASVDFATERKPPAGELTTIIAVLIDHYERRGDLVIRMLAQEENPRVASIVATGRLVHREWVAAAFGSQLPGDAPAREAMIDLLVVATDVYAWKLLRRDRGLDRTVVDERIRALVTSVLSTPPGK